MELKSEEGSLLGYNSTSIFPPQTLDPHLVQQNPKRPSSVQFNGGGDCKIQPKSTGSSGGGGGGARFRECRKNHAASAGGKVFDGCGEFMPAGDDGLDALRCAACNCHRNFHRKELDAGGGGGGDFARLARRTMLHPLQLPPPLKNHWTPVVQPVKMAYGGGNGGTDSSSEDLNFSGYQSNAAAAGGVAPPPPPFVMSKKRFRTRFTAEQKGKMMEYAEKVGWRIPREDDVDVQRFCGEIGVKRQVFKVWMHNNKNTTKKSGQNQEDES